MTLDLVIDIGNSKIKAGLFKERQLESAFSGAAPPFPGDAFAQFLDSKKIARALVASVNQKVEAELIAFLENKKIPFIFLDHKKIKLKLDVDEPDQLGHDRIANCYGALLHFPLNDCVIIDSGTAITADFVTKEGCYLGGMIYPGLELCAKALADYTDKLFLVAPKKPNSPLAKTTETHLQAGIYYGVLGATERMIAELQRAAPTHGTVKVLATGGATKDTALAEDLNELVDLIDPHLTLRGLREILDEHKSVPSS